MIDEKISLILHEFYNQAINHPVENEVVTVTKKIKALVRDSLPVRYDITGEELIEEIEKIWE